MGWVDECMVIIVSVSQILSKLGESLFVISEWEGGTVMLGNNLWTAGGITMDRKHNTHSHLQALEQTCDPGHRVGLYCKNERLCVIINPSPQGSSDRSQLFFSAAAIKSKGYQGIKKKMTKPTGPSRARIQPAPPSVLPSPPLLPAPSPVRRLRSLNRHFRQVSKNLFFLFPFSWDCAVRACMKLVKVNAGCGVSWRRALLVWDTLGDFDSIKIVSFSRFFLGG